MEPQSGAFNSTNEDISNLNADTYYLIIEDNVGLIKCLAPMLSILQWHLLFKRVLQTLAVMVLAMAPLWQSSAVEHPVIVTTGPTTPLLLMTPH